MTDHPSRRTVLAGAAALGVARQAGADPATLGPSAVQSETVRGVVTEAAASSAPDAATRPIAGVLVSNGRDVVRTDASGRYSVPISPGQTVFVVKPSGYQVPVDPATKLPRFAHVHDPEGTPAALGFRYGGLAPTGPLPASLDFQLTRVEEPRAFEVILFADPQPESTAELEFIRDDVVAGLIGADSGAKAAFGITCGDLMFDDLSMYGRYNRIIGAIGLPWWSIGGNHDLDYEAPDAKRSRDTWKRVFGASYYAHEYAGALFVMLDNVDYLGAGTGKPGERGAYRGFFPPDQLMFVKNLLEATPMDRLVVVAMHIPLRTYLDPEDPAENTANAADLLKLLAGRPSLSLSGHTHSTEHHYLEAADGIPGPGAHHHHVLTAVCGSWWSGPLDHRGIASADSWDGTPNGYHVLSIDGAAYTTRYVPAAEPAGTQMRISLDTAFHEGDREIMRTLPMEGLLRSPISMDQVAATRVVVNVFDGGPRTKVSFVLDDGAPIPMTRMERADPFIVQVYGRHPETIKRWVSPKPSSHLWVAPLPRGLVAGAYALKARATDEYGRAHAAAMVLEVT